MKTVGKRSRREGVARRRTTRTASAALIGAVVLAGCGGKDDGTAGSSAAAGNQPLDAFRAQADVICAAVSRELAQTELPHSFPADIKEFDKKSRTMLAVIEEPFTKLVAIAPPAGQEAAFARFSTALTSAVAEAKRLRALVEAGNDDTDALWLPRTNVATHHAKAMNEAITLGLESCDELDYKEVPH